MFVLYRDLLMFSAAIALMLVCTRGHAHNWLFESSALIGQCLNSWHVTFRTHNTDHIACSILSSFPYYILLKL